MMIAYRATLVTLCIYASNFDCRVADAAATSGTGSSGDFLAVTWDGEILRIDPDTGANTTVTANGFERTNSLSVNSKGDVYSIRSPNFSISNPIPGRIVQVDTTSNSATLEENITPDLDIRAIAFAPNDDLFAIVDQGGIGSEDLLYKINPVNGSSVLIGTTGLPGLQGLTFTPDGSMLSWDSSVGNQDGIGLIQIDPQTGAATDLHPTDEFEYLFQSLAFDDAGRLYAVTADGSPTVTGPPNSLFSINLQTGEPTPIGSFGSYDVRGIVYIPTPASLSQFALAALTTRRRR